MSQLPWLQPALQQFRQQQQAGRLAHALLLPLTVGDGGLLLAEQFVALTLCEQHSACGMCRSCKLLQAGNHPDVHWLKADGNQIKVEQVRELCQSLTATAQQGGYRVAVIEQSERMNTAAANALLKTLEEPGRNTLLILQTDISSSLLPTITSRCQRVAAPTPTAAQVQQWLAPQTLTDDVLAWALPVLGGALALRDALQSDRFAELAKLKDAIEQSFISGHVDPQLADIKEDSIFDALSLSYRVLLQQMRAGNKDAFVMSAIAALAERIMRDSQQLRRMPTVNYLALIQSYVLDYNRLKN
ncbi:DNA polymerase III subunit delta' [Shewanella sp. C32]|uniref:DNA-directed DNA polymerase n=1 Tax=Shewanella electrica TaxID=515560 RepID=A0ABT2FKR6_9GAMM|nr:DNA polymerase III subunit delta' [Shewanella electrica]MCH1923699.1 DNA polymerase III subunit delta' [Shewanella electrica]MCS4556918.1 DNA polymerase III subunit delta' [Shewanella electrica]